MLVDLETPATYEAGVLELSGKCFKKFDRYFSRD